jgi:molecular chaperone GrpE
MDAKPEQETPEAAPEQDNIPAAAEPSPQDILKKLEEEIALLKDQRVRALAEADNIRKRAQREQEELAKYAVTSFARDMVSVLENLNRATESVKAHKNQSSEELLKTFAEGIDLTQRELLGIFEKFQIKRLDPQGQKFDHNFHQAVAQVEQPDAEPGTVIQVVQAGYVIHDRLLRPAMVVVAKATDPEKKTDTNA